MTEPEPARQRQQVLVGTWRTTGRTDPSAGSAGIDATDTYEWLPGGFGLLHTVDARVGDQNVEGAEIIGYDPSRGTYVTLYVGSDGPSSYEARLIEEDGGLIWLMQSEGNRFTGTIDDNGRTIMGHWEPAGENGSRRPWMDVTLIKG
jgi:hypothetical protein